MKVRSTKRPRPEAATFILRPRFAGPVDLRDLHGTTVDFLRTWTRIGGEVLPASFGEILRNGRYPLVHMANTAWVDVVPPGGVEAILRELDRAFAGTAVRHRHLFFTHASRAYDLQEAFVERGFHPTAELVLAKVGLPVCVTNPDVEVREVGVDAHEPEFRAVTVAVHTGLGYTSEESRQVYEMDRERAAETGERWYVAFHKGDPAGTFTLWPRGRFGLIGNVGTVPEHRKRGVGRTMIFEACSRAIDLRVEYALLTTALLGAPKVMYQTLGFQPVGELRGFLKA